AVDLRSRGPHLPCDQQRLRSHARPRRADTRARSVGHRRLRPHAPVQSIARDAQQDPGEEEVSVLPPPADWPDLARWQRGALIAGAVGGVVCLGGAFIAPDDFFRSWLVAFNLVLGLALGSLVIVMLQYLTGGTWAS